MCKAIARLEAPLTLGKDAGTAEGFPYNFGFSTCFLQGTVKPSTALCQVPAQPPEAPVSLGSRSLVLALRPAPTNPGPRESRRAQRPGYQATKSGLGPSIRVELFP